MKDDKYNHTGRLLSWIVRIAHNLIIDHYRKINTNKTYSHEEKEMDFISNKYLSADSVEDEIVKDQVIRDVRKLVSMLPIEQREVIILRHYVGMSFKEIAEETNVSINTALGRMRYAVMNMRRMIKEHDLTFSFA
ncbi:MAG: sigma-70 family RNA polymerase sigma factor [Bacteroidetes bacterium]|nr:sigma-70 family RNA polymerase sigma factor [Bacteroidota bacterium]